MTVFADTNILARLMTNDVPTMSAQAAQMVEACKQREIIVLDAVLVELFFVLQTHSQYRFPKTTIVDLFQSIILPTPQFVVSPSAISALDIYKSQPKLDFMDCLLSVYAGSQKKKLLSFDQDLLNTLK